MQRKENLFKCCRPCIDWTRCNNHDSVNCWIYRQFSSLKPAIFFLHLISHGPKVGMSFLIGVMSTGQNVTTFFQFFYLRLRNYFKKAMKSHKNYLRCTGICLMIFFVFGVSQFAFMADLNYANVLFFLSSGFLLLHCMCCPCDQWDVHASAGINR